MNKKLIRILENIYDMGFHGSMSQGEAVIQAFVEIDKLFNSINKEYTDQIKKDKE